ncbi:hypothetical protein RSOLAG22IIIB_05527 [Rhizoctonia solani]|uniref:Uncharacterized protein n=1 Tax=Rhizoctonia solani TaxID=456999 RepID=A0A0K6G6W1_9AGAM|nr:hypothetical protein RSOLAG22IIIB_05527 [Rhizoctonia solani]
MEQRIAQKERQFDQIKKQIEFNRIAIARAMNLRGGPPVRLYPIPLPNGDELPADQFPATHLDFYGLTDQALRNLIVRYELASPDSVPETTKAKRKILAEHIGISC